jgi:hypothetical protein
VLLLADCPCADTDAPVETIELAAACFRFARDGDVGAGGSVGGVRAPLAAMVMVKGAVRDARAMRSAETRSVVASLCRAPTMPSCNKRKNRLATPSKQFQACRCLVPTRRVVVGECWGAVE